MARQDVHRPAVIEPADYEFVAFNYLKIEDLGSAIFMREQRERLQAHKARTGGAWSDHGSGGCHVCGSTNMIYSAAFWHAKSGAYLRVGLDCAQKLECEGIEAFRRNVANALEGKKGKRKAKAVLEKAGLGKAWMVYVSAPESPSKEEETVLDIVGRLIQWGDISPKAQNYLAVLCDRIARAPEIAAQRAAENEAAAPVPVVPGRVTVRGKVVSIKQPQPDDFYPALKMLIVADGGWKVFGSVPAAIRSQIERGDEVEFVCSIKVSDRDPKFGFISRPAKARIVKKVELIAA